MSIFLTRWRAWPCVLTVLAGAVLLLGSTQTMAAYPVIDDFRRDDPGLQKSPAYQSSILPFDSDGTPASVLALDWPAKHGAYFETYYVAPRPIPNLQPNRPVFLRTRLWVPPAPSINTFSVRLSDARSTFYQWTVPVTPGREAGWQTIVIPIKPDSPNARWGGSSGSTPTFPFKLAGFALGFANTTVPQGRVLIDQLIAQPMPSITLETNRFPHLVNTTSDARCELVLTHHEDRAVPVKLEGKLTNFAGQGTPISAQVELPPQGTARLPLEVLARDPGIYYVTCNWTIDGQAFTDKTAFVIAEPVQRAQSRDDFLFGICSHTERVPADEHELEMQAAAAAGATVMRVGASWAMLEPKPGEWRWDIQDRLVDLAAKHGIEIQALLGYGPAHAVSEQLRAAQREAYQRNQPDAYRITLFGPPEEEPWRRYVRNMVSRYQGRIRFYEVWNEPDLGFWRGTTDEYIQLLRAASQEIRQADPKAIVLSGGFATVLEHAGRARNPDLQQRVLAEASDAFDIHVLHQHGPFSEFKHALEGELPRLRRAMSTPRPLYFNETAISSSFDGGERAQAHTLVKKIAYTMAKGAIGYTWYDLRNDGINPANPEHNYGLLSERLIPKASFAAYSELVRRLHSARHLGDLNLGAGVQAHVFSSPRSRVMVWWKESSSAADVALVLRSGAGAVRVTNIMGVSKEVTLIDGCALLQPTTEPQYIELPASANMPETDGVLVQLEGGDEALIDQPSKLTAVLRNPLRRTIEVNLQWREASGKTANRTVAIPAAGSERAPMTLTAPWRRAASQRLEVQWNVRDLPWSGVASRTVPVVRIVDSQGPENRNPDWTLDQPTDVVNFTLADPSLTGMHWSGSEDLSARIWLWRVGDALHVRADVRDDKHCQSEKPETMWRGDSIQVSLGSRMQNTLWEIGASLDAEGRVQRFARITAPGVQRAETMFDARCEPIVGGFRYELILPLGAFGLDHAELAKGVRFNLAVNDNDAGLRKQVVRIGPGMVEKKDAMLFPVIYLTPPPLTR